MPSVSAMRVSDNTLPAVNEQIQRRTKRSIAYFAEHSKQIDRRLKELDQEWDIERVLETGASAITLATLVMGIARRKRWFLVSILVQSFMMQHAMQGWCPPLPVLRRLGFRTVYEIERERSALRALRGDFGKVEPEHVLKSLDGHKGD
jgi:hypothetical protein